MTAAALLHFCYLFMAIFGVGVTVIDLLGLLGGDTSSDHSATDHSAIDHGTIDHSVAADHQASLDHSDHAGHSHDHSHVPLLSVLGYLRIFVYFSLGFGPLGLMAESNGAGLLGSLIWASTGGILVTLMARYFFRFQQRDIDSSVRVEDLFLGTARVIVPINNGRMGKVRVQIGQSIAERYALAENAEDSFPNDTEVQIVRVDEECVYVRRLEDPGNAIKRALPNKVSS